MAVSTPPPEPAHRSGCAPSLQAGIDLREDNVRRRRLLGANGSGELGNGTTTDSHFPTAPALVATMDLGVWAEFAVPNKRPRDVLGRNVQGQLGNSSFTDSLVPVATSITAAAGLSVGARTACVIGPARCWGDNVEGQLGIGTFTVVPPTGANTPAPVIDLPAQPTQIAVGETFVCSVMPNTHVWCWGLNSAGQLGVATPVQSATPVEVTFH